MQTSKNIDALVDIEFDYVVTACDKAHQSCPFFPS
jgi:arsenate reductase